MALDCLPEELLIIILRQLDSKSLYNLFNTGNERLRTVISTKGVTKKISFSLNNMATVHSLKSLFFKDISTHLLELNLSGVHDLNKTALLPGMRKLKSLLSLNVAYTDITILDFLDIYKLCPTIINIEIDFTFHKNGQKRVLRPQVLTKCQEVFKNIVNVNFVGSYYTLLDSTLPQNILQKAKVDSLTYTVAKQDTFTYHKYAECDPIHCNKICVYFFNWKKSIEYHFRKEYVESLSRIPFQYEYVYIAYREIYCSSLLFKKFFGDFFKHLDVYVSPHIYNEYADAGHVEIMIWNKETTKFDASFFTKLLVEARKVLPSVHIYAQNLLPYEVNNTFVCLTHPILDYNSRDRSNDHRFKMQRVAIPNITLDYDHAFEGRDNIELSLHFLQNIGRPVTLSTQSTFLRKLTYLSMIGDVRYSSEFFNILFRCCENLITLCVFSPSISPCAAPITRAIPLSRSIKNLRLEGKALDFTSLFSSLGNCKTLENVQLIDTSDCYTNLTDTYAFIRQCNNLYYIHIEVEMTDSLRVTKLKMLNEAKRKCGKNHLLIVLTSPSKSVDYFYDPYVSVFRLNSIQVFGLYFSIFINLLHRLYHVEGFLLEASFVKDKATIPSTALPPQAKVRTPR